MWIWLLISIFNDVLRDPELRGPAKASWLVALLILPYLGVFIYLIVRGGSMHERQVQRQAQAEQAVNTDIREIAAAPSPAEELARLVELRDRGILNDDEFGQQKARTMACSPLGPTSRRRGGVVASMPPAFPPVRHSAGCARAGAVGT